MTQLRFTPYVEQIPVYPAAKTYAVGGPIAKLASNESPYPPHPAVVTAIEHAARNINRYPDPSGAALRDALTDRYGVPGETLTLANGSCEILLAAAQAMLEPGAEIVYAWPSFSMYPHLAAMTGATAIEVPLDSDHRHDMNAMAKAVTERTRIVIVCNPNNPSATFVPCEELEAFIAEIPPHVCVIVDEAYTEFVNKEGDPSIELPASYANAVILRTFSKAYGLAGLRIGFAIGSEEFRAALDLIRQPFSVNMLAQVAATEALNHEHDVTERVSHTWAERRWVEDHLHELGIKTAETQANFGWVDLGGRDEDNLIDFLAREGVIVRAGKALGQEGFLRVTYGTRNENERFVTALTGALHAADSQATPA